MATDDYCYILLLCILCHFLPKPLLLLRLLLLLLVLAVPPLPLLPTHAAPHRRTQTCASGPGITGAHASGS